MSDEVVIGNNEQSCSYNSSIRNGRNSIDEATIVSSSNSTSSVFNLSASSLTSSTLQGSLTTAVASSSSLDSSEREMRLLRRNQRVGHRQKIQNSLRYREKAKIRSIDTQIRHRSSTPTSTITSINFTSVESAMLNDNNLVDVTDEIDAMDHESLHNELIEDGIFIGTTAPTNNNVNTNFDDLNNESNANGDDNMSNDDNSNNQVLI